MSLLYTLHVLNIYNINTLTLVYIDPYMFINMFIYMFSTKRIWWYTRMPVLDHTSLLKLLLLLFFLTSCKPMSSWSQAPARCLHLLELTDICHPWPSPVAAHLVSSSEWGTLSHYDWNRVIICIISSSLGVNSLVCWVYKLFFIVERFFPQFAILDYESIGKFCYCLASSWHPKYFDVNSSSWDVYTAWVA